MKYTHVLWDFNGTLLDDVEPCIKSINELLTRHGLEKLTGLSQYQSVFGFPIIDYYRRIGFDFDKTSYDELAVEWVKLYNEYNRPLKLCPGADKALSYLKERGVRQFILTASSVDMVRSQLSELGIGGYFDEIIGVDNIHAFGKSGIAAEWIKREKPESAVLIGDSDHDSEVASAVGIDCLLVSCGHMNAEKLAHLRAVFRDPFDAVKSISE